MNQNFTDKHTETEHIECRERERLEKHVKKNKKKKGQHDLHLPLTVSLSLRKRYTNNKRRMELSVQLKYTIKSAPHVPSIAQKKAFLPRKVDASGDEAIMEALLAFCPSCLDVLGSIKRVF